MRRALVSTLTLAAVCIGAGCTPNQPTPPPPTTSTTTRIPPTTTGTSTALRPTVAPPITRAFDLRRYLNRPCDLLTLQQQVAAGLPSQPPEATDRDACKWSVGVPGTQLIAFIAIGLDLLGNVYRDSNYRGEHGDGPLRWGVFEPLTIAGQPAVVLASRPGDGACEVIVGVGPEQAIQLLVGGGHVIDACGTGIAVAEQMVNNLAA